VTILIEAAVESLDAALAAAEGGAHRIELCADLARSGTTPDVQLVRACRSQLTIPIFVLVRARAGDFVYTDAEHHTMIDQIRRAKEAGAQGIVTGELQPTSSSVFSLASWHSPDLILQLPLYPPRTACAHVIPTDARNPFYQSVTGTWMLSRTKCEIA